jgi:hypothetical protein
MVKPINSLYTGQIPGAFIAVYLPGAILYWDNF